MHTCPNRIPFNTPTHAMYQTAVYASTEPKPKNKFVSFFLLTETHLYVGASGNATEYHMPSPIFLVFHVMNRWFTNRGGLLRGKHGGKCIQSGGALGLPRWGSVRGGRGSFLWLGLMGFCGVQSRPRNVPRVRRSGTVPTHPATSDKPAYDHNTPISLGMPKQM